MSLPKRKPPDESRAAFAVEISKKGLLYKLIYIIILIIISYTETYIALHVIWVTYLSILPCNRCLFPVFLPKEATWE